jgi:hypothetical protein
LGNIHLKDIERIEKLIAIVFIAFLWYYSAGIFIHKNTKGIKIEKHGY